MRDKRVLKIECGSVDEPCDLKKEITVIKNFNRKDYINTVNKKNLFFVFDLISVCSLSAHGKVQQSMPCITKTVQKESAACFKPICLCKYSVSDNCYIL